MTKILVNDARSQHIFNSYSELERMFNTTDYAIKTAEVNGTLLRDNVSGHKYYVDKLFTLEDVGKCEKENTK